MSGAINKRQGSYEEGGGISLLRGGGVYLQGRQGSAGQLPPRMPSPATARNTYNDAFWRNP